MGGVAVAWPCIIGVTGGTGDGRGASLVVVAVPTGLFRGAGLAAFFEGGGGGGGVALGVAPA
jgi:hypothetical protein